MKDTPRPADLVQPQSPGDAGIFPPIDVRNNNREPETNLSPNNSPPTCRRMRAPLPPKYLMYRKWGLVTNGGRGVYTLADDNPEVTSYSQQLPARGETTSPLIRQRTMFEPKRQSVPARQEPTAAFLVTGRELEGGRAIRRKIEQFRHWHEQQYRQKLESLKTRADLEHGGKIKAAEIIALAGIYKDRLGEPTADAVAEDSRLHKPSQPVRRQPSKYNNALKPGPGETHQHMNKPAAASPAARPGAAQPALKAALASPAARPAAAHPHEPLPRLTSNLALLGQPRNDVSIHESTPSPRPETPPAPVPDELKSRVFSAKTWRTWRDVNDSYAYTDVRRYIQDNDLMDKDKERHIDSWVDAVETARHLGKCIGIDGRPITSSHSYDDSDTSSTAS